VGEEHVSTPAASEAPLLHRTKAFAVRIVRLTNQLPAGRVCDVIGKQLLCCATSVGANYRAAQRARSPAEFCAKLGIVEEEADEALYWLELLVETGLVKEALLRALLQEANEILSMVIASIKTARKQTTQGKNR
jgi:four helix bundle protein